MGCPKTAAAGPVSISRAARHDLPNHLFKAIVLPAAALQGLTWILCQRWLLALGAPRTRWLRQLAWIGVTAAVFLVLYTAFLGTEGRIYRWLRHPIYAGTLLTFWAATDMSQGRLLLAGVFTLYLLVGLRLEERDLETELGPRYRDYRRRVGGLLPRRTPGTRDPGPPV